MASTNKPWPGMKLACSSCTVCGIGMLWAMATPAVRSQAITWMNALSLRSPAATTQAFGEEPPPTGGVT